MTPEETLHRTQWDFFWVPKDTTVIDRPELLYTTCPRDIVNLNMVTRIDVGFPDPVALVQEFSEAHRDRRSRVQVLHGPERDPLRNALRHSGYREDSVHDALTLPVGNADALSSDDFRVERVQTRTQLADLHRVAESGFGRTTERSEVDIAQELRELTRPRARIVRFVVYDRASDTPLSSGGLTLFRELRFGFLWAGSTIPDARGRGAYSALLAARTQYARALGLERVGVYGLVDTSSPILQRRGFERNGGMSFWDRPPQTSTTG